MVFVEVEQILVLDENNFGWSWKKTRIVEYKYRVFTWRHGGHVGVPKQGTASILVFPTNPVRIELYSYTKVFFCFWLKNVIIDHVSESTLYKMLNINISRSTKLWVGW